MTQLEALRINNIVFLFPPLVLGSNPSGPTSVFGSGVFHSADLSVFRGVNKLQKTVEPSRLGLLWKEAIRGCAFRWRKKSRCRVRARTAEVEVHQFPPAAQRLARYTC